MHKTTLIIAGLLLLLAPTAAADDPSYSVPDAAPLADAADGFASGTADAATGTVQSNNEQLMWSANDVQELTLPASRVSTVLDTTTGFADATVAGAGALAVLGVNWGASVASTKVVEAFSTIGSTDEVGASGIAAAGKVLTSAAETVCDTPNGLVTDGSCTEESLVASALGSAGGVGEQAGQNAQNDHTDDSRAQACAFVESFLGVSCDPPE